MLRFLQKQYRRAAITMGVGMGVMISILYSMIFPHLQFIRHLRADGVRPAASRCRRPRGADRDDWVYRAELVVLSGGWGKGVGDNDNYLEKTPEANWPRWVTIDSQIWDKTPVEIQNRFNMIAAEWGVNYSSAFKQQTVYLLEKREIGQ